MSAEQIAEIRVRLGAITPGAWRKFNYAEFEDDSLPPENAWWLDGPAFVPYDVYSLFKQEDAEFIAHAPDDLRALLDQHDADQQRIAALESALTPLIKAAQWNARYSPDLQGAVNDALSVLKGGDDDNK